MKAAKPLHIVLATNPNPTRARGYPLNINPKPDPKPDSISGPAGSGRVADLYIIGLLRKEGSELSAIAVGEHFTGNLTYNNSLIYNI